MPWNQTKPIVGKRPNIELINKQERYWYLVDLTIPADRRIRMKESKIINRYLDFSKELKMLRIMIMTIKQIIAGALQIVPKRLESRLKELEIRGWIETTQTTALLRSARIIWMVQNFEFYEKPPIKTGVKDSEKVKKYD